MTADACSYWGQARAFIPMALRERRYQPMMTSRDFIVLAGAFAHVYDDTTSDTARVGVNHAVQAVADALEADNPRFNRMAFYEAAHVPPRSLVYRRAAQAARIRALNTGK